MPENAAELQKLTIQTYSEPDHGGSTETYTVMFNPSSLKHDYSIKYNTEQATNEIASDNSFKNTDPETVSFELIYDGTGATGEKIEVWSEIRNLKKAVYD
ncbi:MAG: hypothetical protein ACK4ND_11115, partial [Cytophagaceae bacterium]